MTISSTTRKAGPFFGNDATTDFPFTFKVFKKQDVRVTLTNPAGEDQQLVLDSAYSLTLNSNQDANPGGTIRYPISGAPLPTLWRLTATGALPNTQPTDIQNNGGFYPQVVEDMGDRSTIQIQQLQEQVDRSLKFSVSDPGAGAVLPPADLRANKVLAFDENGKPITVVPVDGSAAAVAIALQNFVTQLFSSAGSALIGFVHGFSGAIRRTVQDRLRDTVSVKDFGAIGDGSYHPLSERFPSLALAQAVYPHVTSLTQSIDWAASQAALNTGRSATAPEGSYVITDLLFPVSSGQTFTGDGVDRTVIKNTVNNEPLWCYGNPYNPDGAAEFSAIRELTLQGNVDGATLWGVYCPTSSGRQYDGCGSSPNNLYFARGHANWNRAARGCRMDNVRVNGVNGGLALHVSAWDFRATRPHLVGNLRGIRNMGDCNSNVYDGAYISSCAEYSILHPNMTDGGAKNTHYKDCIVQQSGWDGNGSISLLFGEGTRVTNPYLERNDEKGGNVDIFVGASESNCVIDGVTHKLEADTGHTQTVIRCAAHNASIRNVDWRNTILYGLDLTSTNLAFAVRYENIRPRNNTPGLATQDVHIANNAIGHITLDAAVGALAIGPHRVGRGDASTGATDKFALRQGRSTSAWAQIESLNGIRFITDVSNLISGGDVEWRHNGEDSTGALLLKLQASNGAFYPGTNGTQNLGTVINPWAQLFAATGTISPSDDRLKKIRGPLTDAEIRAWESVQPVIFQFLDAIDQKGDDARLHAGYRAQAVEAAFIAEGLDPRRYALFCEDDIVKAVAVRKPVPQQQYRVTSQRTEQIEIVDGVPVLTFVEEQVQVPLYEYLPLHDAAGNPVLDDLGNPRMHQVPVTQMVETDVQVDEPAGTQLGLRYEECLVWRDAYGRWKQQQTDAQILAQAQEILALKDGVSALEARVLALEGRP